MQNHHISQETMNAILDAIKHRFPEAYPFFLVQAELGLRPSEALALTTDDFFGTAVTVNTAWSGKGLVPLKSNPRVESAPTTVADVLTQHIGTIIRSHPGTQHPLFLFTNRQTGKPFRPAYVMRMWRLALADLNLSPISLLALRMSALTERALPPR
ncbi:MAG: hypothetical protein H8K08_13825 [Nitrospira sp.]|nr:hypothetical protein [Nitrospira sp.]